MSHDQLSKSLITTFFCDFLRLAAPDSAPRLRAEEAIFLDKEFFTDWPDGNRRELDLLARVPTDEDGSHLLVHVEIEARAGAAMGQRMWSYYMQIRLRRKLLVLPIVVNLRGGRPGAELEILAEGVETALPVCSRTASWDSPAAGRKNGSPDPSPSPGPSRRSCAPRSGRGPS